MWGIQRISISPLLSCTFSQAVLDWTVKENQYLFLEFIRNRQRKHFAITVMEHINRLLWHMNINKVLLFRQLNKYISLREAFKNEYVGKGTQAGL